MAHGKIRVNTLTYDTGSGDVDVAVSGIPDSTAMNAKANKNDAALTGTPTAPTAAVSTNTTQLATTAFVIAEIADEVGTTVQAFDADTAKTDVAQTFTAPQRGTVTEYTGTSFTINFGTTNNFVLKPSGNYTVALSGLTRKQKGKQVLSLLNRLLLQLLPALGLRNCCLLVVMLVSPLQVQIAAVLTVSITSFLTIPQVLKKSPAT